jgi:hypothetical protein
VLRLLRFLVSLAGTTIVILTPAVGVWVASSLAAYRSAPVWAPVAAGVLLFPTLPLGWEVWAGRRRARRAARALAAGRQPRRAWLTFGDRFILRTLALNLLFLGVLLALRPEQAFAALSTRGDWVLDGHHGEMAKRARRGLFVAADRLEWLYRAAHDNPYRRYGDDPGPAPSPSPAPPPRAADADAGAAPAVATAPDAGAAPAPEAPREPAPASAGTEPAWPLPATLHPLLASLPAAVETDPAAVGRYLREQEPDPYGRLKALHDYVADRIVYDVEAYRTRRLPPQDAATVFRTRRAVCAGYAKLLEALGRAAGIEIVYVTGDARSRAAGLSGEGHAWNAARLDGRWYLVDATWDAGSLDGARFVREYRTDYLMTPPEIFGVDHFPDRPGWQLRPTPLTRGEFLRQPALTPRFYALGLELVEPTRSQTDVRGAFDVRLRNRRGYFLLATANQLDAAGAGQRCEVTNGLDVRIRCQLAAPGPHRVLLFGNAQRYGTFAQLGQLEVNNAP